MTFDDIINSVSDEEAIAHLANQTAIKESERREKGNHLMLPEEQRYNLAFYAKMAREHVGWDNFSSENKTAFMSNVEELYNGISRVCRQDEFMRDIFNATGKYIEDRHFTMWTGDMKDHLVGGGEKEERSVGRNFAKLENKPEGYECLGKEIARTPNGEEAILWEIGAMKGKGGEDVLVVAVPNFWNKGNTYDDWAQFIETFDKAYLSNKEKWEKGRIVLDVRNNGGGEDKALDHVAKRLYGNMVNTYKRCEIRDTALSNAILHTHGAYKDTSLARDGLSSGDLVQRKSFSGKNQTLFDETEVFYPFNLKDGYRGRIDILVDRDVGSSAESAYTSFYHHPNVRYIGENTAGMQQFTQGTFNLPCGYALRVGVTKLTYYDKEGENIEVKGHKPDVNCSKKDAFEQAMEIGLDEGRVLGFREINEARHGKLTMVTYDPKAATDPRKAYYAKYLEVGLLQVEETNRRNQGASYSAMRGGKGEERY